MSASLTEFARVYLPARVAVQTQAHLRAVGLEGYEGMALWVGKPDGAQFNVLDVIIPQQHGHRTEHGLAVSVPGEELHRINMKLYRAGLRLIAQVHSHPTEAYHSDTDDEYAITTALGSLSIVIPDFAERSFRLDDCAAYRLSLRPWWHFSSRPRWRRLKLPELEQTLIVGP